VPAGQIIQKANPSARHSPPPDPATRRAWAGERAATDILTLARKGRAFAALDALIARQGGRHVLYGSALVLAAALVACSRHADTPVTDLPRPPSASRYHPATTGRAAGMAGIRHPCYGLRFSVAAGQ
jgi:hypothetical protein